MKPSKARRKAARAAARAQALASDIQATAKDRQEAWAETDRKDLTKALSMKLNGPDGLYAALRQERFDPRTPYFGMTTNVRGWTSPKMTKRPATTPSASSKHGSSEEPHAPE